MHRWLVIVSISIALSATACVSDSPTGVAGTAQVISIIDGDTVIIDFGGTRERVRLLGIDTPETQHPTRPVECFGRESSGRITELIPPGSAVRVERDQEARDHYGRLLLYVFRAHDGLFVNHAMVIEGFATTLHIEPNGIHRTTLAAAETQARNAGRGLWGTCGGPGVALDPLATR